VRAIWGSGKLRVMAICEFKYEMKTCGAVRSSLFGTGTAVESLAAVKDEKIDSGHETWSSGVAKGSRMREGVAFF
jgi:hypothetical protein